jgi:hypothetical protein
MKSIKIAGLCLVAMFAVSMVAAGTASAAPHWLVCLPWTNSPTRYSTHQCKEAASGGSWEWSELNGTEAARAFATLKLKDLKLGVEVICTGEGNGSVGPKKLDRIVEIVNISCVKGAGCEKLEGNAKPLNLPWQTELAEVPAGSGKIRDNIVAENKKGAGWAVTCKVAGIKDTDECTTEEGSVGVSNVWTHGVEGELLVLGDFESESPKANCSLGGAKEGEVAGTVALLLVNNWGLRVSL